MSPRNGPTPYKIAPEREMLLHSQRIEQHGLRFYVLQLQGSQDSPATLNPTGLRKLQEAIDHAAVALEDNPYDYLVVAGTQKAFCAGADLGVAEQVADETAGRALGKLGHDTFTKIETFPVPSIALLQGLAVGGGLELALHCDYRVSFSAVGPFGLPEVSLGIVPGWGGSFLLPHLVGIEHALDVMVKSPAAGRPGLKSQQAYEIGLIDFIVPPDDGLSEIEKSEDPLLLAVTQVARAIDQGDISIQANKQTPRFEPHSGWVATIETAQAQLEQGPPFPPSAFRAIELLKISATADRHASREAEISHLAQSIISPEAKASLYSRELLRSARKQAKALAAQDLGWQRIGIVGAGSMAVQIAVVIASSLKLPVYLRDINDEQVAHAIQRRDEIIEKAVKRGKLNADDARSLGDAITVGTSMDPFKNSDLIIEAVSENMAVKKQVFAELEALAQPQTILASNTSALSISHISQSISSPERMVGIHFFNPVERMPLVEIIRGKGTAPATVDQANIFVAKLSKIGITAADAPGFVVNRLLLRYLGVSLAALERHTPASVVIAVSRRIGLPMNPLELIDLVSPHITADVLRSLRADFGPRFHHSPGLEFLAENSTPFYVPDPHGTAADRRPAQALNQEALAAFGAEIPAPDTDDSLLESTQRALAEEVSLMLREGVVTEESVIDLGMLLGAGWPAFRGGLTPYLRSIGMLRS